MFMSMRNKDPHFQRGRNLVNGQDFKGAVEEFEKALETNPRSAAAHFELGWLYENKVNDYAAAIYHYQRYLQLQPNSERSHAIDVQERIRGCKQQLANTEFPLPNSQNLQREVDRLTAENLLLRQQLDTVKTQAAAMPSRAAAGRTAAAVQTRRRRSAPAPAPVAAPVPGGASHAFISSRSGKPSARLRRSTGVKASAILAANPQVEPRRLRVGQSLNLP